MTHRRRQRIPTIAALMLGATAVAAPPGGIVLDLNGRPVAQAQVSYTFDDPEPGPDVITVFTGDNGRFLLPAGRVDDAATRIGVRGLGYETASLVIDADAEPGDAVTVVMRPQPNQAGVAPASAWLRGITDRKEKSRFVNACVGCHQVPSVAVRDYAALVAGVNTGDPAEVRRQSWLSIAKYMNYLWGWEFGRGRPGVELDPHGAYAVGPGEDVAATMARHFTDSMDRISAYDWGAPVIATPDTVIREYTVGGTNAIREAVLAGSPKRLWVADVATNRMVVIDPASGEQQVHEVPYDGAMGPHSLHRAPDDSLWVTPFFPTVVARVDPDEGSWTTWPMVTNDGETVGIHDLSFGARHELLTDDGGRIWYSDIRNNAVGYFHPDSGDSRIYRAPEIEGRPGSAAALYGLVMTADRKHVWYSQLGIGSFGSFNVETREFDTRVVLDDANAGPRRLTIDDRDVMYVPLYGSGQLIEYDTRGRKQLGIHDLPDTGSAPYAVTWDPVRRVVWIATSNADAIYRFDPATKRFGVLPMPRQDAFLRMIDIDPGSGVLVTSYANIVEFVAGPRMALIIDPGDGAYDRQLAEATR